METCGRGYNENLAELCFHTNMSTRALDQANTFTMNGGSEALHYQPL